MLLVLLKESWEGKVLSAVFSRMSSRNVGMVGRSSFEAYSTRQRVERSMGVDTDIVVC